jgi:hypothetical protein
MDLADFFAAAWGTGAPRRPAGGAYALGGCARGPALDPGVDTAAQRSSVWTYRGGKMLTNET